MRVQHATTPVNHHFANSTTAPKQGRLEPTPETETPDSQLDFFQFSAHHPKATAFGVGASTMLATAIPGIIAGVAAASVPGLSATTVGALEMFSAFSVMGSLASGSWAFSKAKRKFRQRAREITQAKLAGQPLPQKGSFGGVLNALGSNTVKGTLMGIGAAGLAATAVELAATSKLSPGLTGFAFAAGFTYLGMALFTHNLWNAELGHAQT